MNKSTLKTYAPQARKDFIAAVTACAIPRLILEKNLYGLDIDDRAAQLAGLAGEQRLEANKIVQTLNTVRSSLSKHITCRQVENI